MYFTTSSENTAQDWLYCCMELTNIHMTCPHSGDKEGRRGKELEFLSFPLPLCLYCQLKHLANSEKWHPSKKGEWVPSLLRSSELLDLLLWEVLVGAEGVVSQGLQQVCSHRTHWPRAPVAFSGTHTHFGLLGIPKAEWEQGTESRTHSRTGFVIPSDLPASTLVER